MPPCCLPYSKGSLYFLRIMLLPAKDQNEPTLSPQLRSLRFRGSSAPQMAQELREGMATRQRDENPWQQTAARDPVRTVSSPSRGTACCSSHFTSALRSLSLSLSLGTFRHRDALFQNMPQLRPCSTASLGQGVRLLPGSPRGFWHHVGTLQKEPKNREKKTQQIKTQFTGKK